MIRIFLVAAILAFGVGRFLITPRLNLPTTEGSYEAFSHLFAGGLFGAWVVNRDRFLWWSFWGLSLLELAMFIVQKYQFGG